MTDAELRLACLDRAIKAYGSSQVSVADVVKAADMFYAYARPNAPQPERGPDGRFKKADLAADPLLEPENYAEEALKPLSLLHRAFGKFG